MGACARLQAVTFALCLLGAGCEQTETAGPSAPDAAPVEACRDAFAGQMEVAAAQIRIRDVTRLESGFSMLATIDGSEVPWECMTDLEGRIAAVTFTGEIADN